MLRLFFFNDPATTEIYTLSLHDALPISTEGTPLERHLYSVRFDGTQRTRLTKIPGTHAISMSPGPLGAVKTDGDRKSTRLNSSHVRISYAVFCLKKKKKQARRCVATGGL